MYKYNKWIVVGMFALTVTSSVCAEPVKTGVLPIDEVSGVTSLPGGGLLIVTDDPDPTGVPKGEKRHERIAFVLKDPQKLQEKVTSADLSLFDSKLFLADTGTKTEKFVDDLEEAVWDRKSKVYLVASHSRNSTGEHKDKRHLILRYQFKTDGIHRFVSTALDNIIQSKDLLQAMELTPAQAGFNIEGAACTDDGELMIGLRAPTHTFKGKRNNEKTDTKEVDDDQPKPSREDAIIIRIKNPDALFDESVGPVKTDVLTLNLRGQGIRAMAYDSERNKFWIVSGLSTDPDFEVTYKWHLYSWKGGDDEPNPEDPKDDEPNPEDPKDKDKKDKVLPLYGLKSPESVCPVTIAGKSYLLLVDDGKGGSSYALHPID